MAPVIWSEPQLDGQALDGQALDGSQEAPDAHSTVVICDTQPIFAQGLAQLLSNEAPEFLVAGLAASTEELLGMAELVRPELVILDACFGTGPAGSLLAAAPTLKVVIMAGADHEVDVGEALAAGVCALLRREQGISEVAQVLRLALRDLLIVPASLAKGALLPGQGGPAALEPVERHILAHIARGATNRDIACALDLSERTVRRRIIQVYRKIQAKDRVDAALWAERHGIRV